MILSLSDKAWKACLVLCAMTALALSVPSLLSSPTFFGPPKVGTLGVTLKRETVLGSSRFIITSLQADSPLHTVGAEVGDRLTWDNRIGPLSSVPGETVGFTLIKTDTIRHGSVTSVPGDIAAAFPAKTQYLSVAYSLTGIVFGLLIGFKRPDAASYRHLALAFLMFPFAFLALIAPPGAIQEITATVAASVSNFVIYGGYVMFAMLYPGDPPEGWRLQLYRMRAVPLGAIALIAAAQLLTAPGGWFIPYREILDQVAMLVIGASVLSCLLEGWLKSQHDGRTRYLWVLLAFGFKIAVLEARSFHLIPGPVANYFALQLLSHLVILYAILRHRILDFGFVMNRTLVYSATSVSLLLSFGVIEWLAEKAIHFESREQNLVLDGCIAVGLILVFHRFHHKVDHLINRVIFQAWFANEAALRLFVKRAAFCTDPDALHRAFGAELQRFTGGARCRIYWKSTAGEFGCVYDSRQSAQERVAIDDNLAVALRSDDSPLELRSICTAAPGEWAFPMIHRATLHGFVVLDGKPGGESYRPDELDIVRSAVRDVGLDLLAMEVKFLESRIGIIELEARVLRSQIQDMVRMHEADRPPAAS